MFPFNVLENAVKKGTIVIKLLNDMAGVTFVNAQETGAPYSIGYLNMELWNFNHSIYIAAAFE